MFERCYDLSDNTVSTKENNMLNTNGQGTLRIEVLLKSIPIVGATITIQKKIGKEWVSFYHTTTNENGVVDSIVLPAPSQTLIPYLEYNIKVTHKEYKQITSGLIKIYSGEKTIHLIEMFPLEETKK